MFRIKFQKNINTKWENEPQVNLIPVITGGMIFATKLIMDLEELSPEKWIVNPIIASAYEYSYNPNKPEVVRVSDYENKFSFNASFKSFSSTMLPRAALTM